MEPIDEPGQRRIVSIPSLTAWLSLCILAAAWGRSLDERWQAVWADVGACGLAASLGLSALESARLANRKRSRERALQARAEFGLAKLNEQGAALDSVNAAIRRLYAFAGAEAHGSTARAGRSRRDQVSRRLSRIPMKIAPVADDGEVRAELVHSIDGSLRELTARGLVFSHSEPFATRIAVLTFTLGKGERLSLVVDILFTEASAEGFTTRGAALDAGVAPREEEPRELVATAEASSF